MQSQRGLATVIGIVAGTLVYMAATYLNTDGFLNFYANLRFGGLLIILFASICAGRLYMVVTPFIIIYEKLRYIGNRPHRELQITNDNSIPLLVIIPIILTFIGVLILPSSRLVYGIFIGTFVTRISKLYFVYRTGYSCRLWWPFSNKSYKTTDVMPEPELRIWWRPVQAYAATFLFIVYASTFPLVQYVIVSFTTKALEGLSVLGI